MRRTLLIVLMVAACSADDPTSSDWLDQWDLDQTETVDGTDVGIDEAEQTIYVEDCDTARKLTAAGERFAGYAYICP